MKSYLLEGLITETEKSEIAERIFEIIENIRNILLKIKFLSERELMIEGKNHRPDRIKIDDAWFIIDFKTGNPSENHQNKLIYTKRWKMGRKLKELIYL